ncbi:MAG: DUF4831 family protein [Acidobacteria bacterium]|nr:DUF4831 family protein [Acidobacteriota bacterium]
MSCMKGAVVVVALGLAGCVSRVNVTRVTSPAEQGGGFALTPQAKEAMAQGGVYYALPRTRVMADIAVERTSFIPGIHADEAAACLGLDPGDVETKPSVTYAVLPAMVTAWNEPDPGQVFVMDIRGRYFEDKVIKAAFSGTGTLSALTAESNDQSLAVALDALNSAAALAGKAGVFGAFDRAPMAEGAKKPAPCEEYNQLLKKRAQVLEGSLGGVTIEGLNRVLAEYDRAIADLRDFYFVGRERKTTFVRRFMHLPAGEAKAELLRFTKTAGVCEASGLLQGSPFPPAARAPAPKGQLEPCACLKTAEAVQQCLKATGESGAAEAAPWLELRYAVPASSMAKVLKNAEERGQRGLYYRVPEQVQVTVGWKASQFGTGLLEIAQLGTVVSMPNSTGGRKTSYTADFTPGGALKNFQVNSTALLDKSSLGAVQSAAEKALEANKAAGDQTAAMNREAARINAEKALIKAQRDLDELKGAGKSTPPPQ